MSKTEEGRFIVRLTDITAVQLRRATVEHPHEDINEDGEHDYESLDGFRIAVDEQSIQTETSGDSAFVDNTLTRSEHSLPTSHPASLSKPYCDYRTLPKRPSNTSLKSKSSRKRVSPFRRPLANELPSSIPRDEVDAIGRFDSAQQWLPREDTEWSHDDAARFVDDSDWCNTYIRYADDSGDVTALKEFTSCSSEKGCCSDEYLDRIQYMVEAFQPLIEGCVNVTDVMPYMTFIEDPEEILNKDKESPKRAVALLIDKIKESESPGKWQTFLQALEKGEYVYIAELIKGETERDNWLNRQLLKVFTPALVDSIDPLHVIDLLYQKSVISQSDLEDIRNEKINRNTNAACMMLLSRIPRKLPNWTEVFIEVLQQCGLQEFVTAFQEINEPVKRCQAPAATGTKSWTDDEEDSYITPVLDALPRIATRLRHSIVPVDEDTVVKHTSTSSSYIEHQPRDELDSEIDQLNRKKAELEREVSKIRQKKLLETQIAALEKERLGLVQSDKKLTDAGVSTSSPDDCVHSATTPESNNDVVDETDRVSETNNTNNSTVADTVSLGDILREIFHIKTGVDSLKHHFTAEIEKLQLQTEPTLADTTDYAALGADNMGYTYVGIPSRPTPVNLFDITRNRNDGYIMSTLPKAHESHGYLDKDSAFCSYFQTPGYIPLNPGFPEIVDEN